MSPLAAEQVEVMPIELSTDEEGETLKTLIWQALRLYPTASLFQFLTDRNLIVRSTAARELQTRPETRLVFDHAVTLIDSEIAPDREIGAFLLGQIGTPDRPLRAESIPLLEGLCNDADPEVRSTALASLSHLSARESQRVIRSALSDPHPVVREMAEYVIECLHLQKQ